MPVEASDKPVPAGQWVRYRGVLVRVVETTIEGHRFQFKPATKRVQERDDSRDLDSDIHSVVD